MSRSYRWAGIGLLSLAMIGVAVFIFSYVQLGPKLLRVDEIANVAIETFEGERDVTFDVYGGHTVKHVQGADIEVSGSQIVVAPKYCVLGMWSIYCPVERNFTLDGESLTHPGFYQGRIRIPSEPEQVIVRLRSGVEIVADSD